MSPIPSSLKLHESSLDQIPLFQSNSIKEISNLQLKVENGVGVKKSGGRNFDFVVENIKTSFSMDPRVALDSLSHATGSESNIWSSYSNKLNNHHSSSLIRKGDNEFCHFSKLNIRQDISMIVIDNLVALLDTPENAELCYSTLLSIIANEKSVIDIRVVNKKKVLNDYNKGIIQTGTREAGYYPYHDAGLRGANQVVGVGDTGTISMYFKS
jgi:hypothetical protein